MRRIPTITAAASAAALAALAVTVAMPALGNGSNDGSATAKPGVQFSGPAPRFDELAACLRNHGLAGAPDDLSLKPWLGERLQRGDAAAKRALAACSPDEPKMVAPGPSPEELRTCLANHGVDVPGDNGATLKRWLIEHGNEAQYRDALKACDIGPFPDGKLVTAVTCDAKGVRGPKPFRAAPADRPKLVGPAGS
jgi:hypothetical protein